MITLHPAAVADLVTRRYELLAAHEEDVDCPELDRVCAAVVGELDPVSQAELFVHAKECAVCSEAVALTLHVRRNWWPIAAGVAVAAAVLIFHFLPVQSEEVRPSAPTPKGGALIHTATDEFSIAVERGPLRWQASPLDALASGDLVGFFYSADAPGYLTVAHVDAAGDVTIVVPASQPESVPISVGQAQPLADSALMTEDRGCNWFVAVFSDTRLSNARVAGALGTARRETDCRLEASVLGARTVVILPLMRR